MFLFCICFVTECNVFVVVMLFVEIFTVFVAGNSMEVELLSTVIVTVFVAVLVAVNSIEVELLSTVIVSIVSFCYVFVLVF
jgi:hypothetical protein